MDTLVLSSSLPHYTYEETEAQRVSMTCSKSLGAGNGALISSWRHLTPRSLFMVSRRSPPHFLPAPCLPLGASGAALSSRSLGALPHGFHHGQEWSMQERMDTWTVGGGVQEMGGKEFEGREEGGWPQVSDLQAEVDRERAGRGSGLGEGSEPSGEHKRYVVSDGAEAEPGWSPGDT